MSTIPKWKYDYILWRIRRFLFHYDRFLDERSIKSNMHCNDSVERLRDVLYDYDNDLI